MSEPNRKTAARCLMIGIVAGMRSMMAPALVLQKYKPEQPMSRTNSLLLLLGSRGAKVFSNANMVGELVGDKMPQAPSRLILPSLVFRCLSGAFSGMLIASSRKKSVLLGAVLGILGAIAGAFGGYHARKWITSHSSIPDRAIGLAEDTIAMTIGKVAVG